MYKLVKIHCTGRIAGRILVNKFRMCQMKRMMRNPKAEITKITRRRDQSVPEFDGAVPATSDHLRSLVRQPLAADADRVVRLEPGEDASRLPVPHRQLAISIPRHNKAKNKKNIEIIVIYFFK